MTVLYKKILSERSEGIPSKKIKEMKQKLYKIAEKGQI